MGFHKNLGLGWAYVKLLFSCFNIENLLVVPKNKIEIFVNKMILLSLRQKNHNDKNVTYSQCSKQMF